MLLALIGDIHANLPALKAVLAEIKSAGCEQVFDLGDIVGYGPFPNECVSLLRRRKVPSVMGNYDRWIQRIHRKHKKVKEKRKDKMDWITLDWTYQQLTEANLEYLVQLPTERKATVAGKRMGFYHGRPESIRHGIPPDTDPGELEEVLDTADVDVLVCGHIHCPFVSAVRGRWVINVGSVGRGHDGDARATWVMAEINTHGLSAEVRRTEYDAGAVAKAALARGLPRTYAQMFVPRRDVGRTVGDVGSSGGDVPQ